MIVKIMVKICFEDDGNDDDDDDDMLDLMENDGHNDHDE